MRVAALQVVSSTDLDHNLARAEALLDEAARRGAAMAVLPEYFCIMEQQGTSKTRFAEAPGKGPVQQMLSAVAARHRMWVVGGSLPLQCPEPDRVYNSTLAFGPDGRVVARYDKMHLFAFERGGERYAEADTIAPGSAPAAFEAQGLRIGMSICYDLRFPELYRALSTPRPCDAFLVPAAFTYTTGSKHWELLLRARAVENLAYVVASAQGGHHANGRRTWGHSMIIDPWGEVLAMLAEGEGVVTADIETERIASWRASLPALDHRRMD